MYNERKILHPARDRRDRVKYTKFGSDLQNVAKTFGFCNKDSLFLRRMTICRADFARVM